MSLPANQSVLPAPSKPPTISYGQTANIDAVNSYPNGFAINLTTTEIGAFLATVPCLIKITAGSSTQAVWIKNTSGNQTMNSVVRRWQRQPHHQLKDAVTLLALPIPH
jgi:hypothetical protein